MDDLLEFRKREEVDNDMMVLTSSSWKPLLPPAGYHTTTMQSANKVIQQLALCLRGSTAHFLQGCRLFVFDQSWV